MELPKDQAEIVAKMAVKQGEIQVNDCCFEKVTGQHTETKERLSQELAELTAALAEAKKPKLKDGDWGLGYRGKHLWVVLDATDPDAVVVAVQDENKEYIEEWNHGVSGATRYGNLRDHLKALLENVTGFEIVDGQVGGNVADGVLICQDTDNVRILPEDLPAFILGLQQIEATMKRKK